MLAMLQRTQQALPAARSALRAAAYSGQLASRRAQLRLRLEGLRAYQGQPGDMQQGWAAGTPPAPQPPGTPIVIADFTVYKSKAALNCKLVPPSWQTKISAGGTTVYTVDRPGGLLLEFANAKGERVYDWEAKATFLLSPLELAGLISDPDNPSNTQLYHDPDKGRANEGQVSKGFSWARAQDGRTHFFTVNITNKAAGTGSTRISVPLTAPELATFTEISRYLIPRLYGFEAAMMAAEYTRPQ